MSDLPSASLVKKTAWGDFYDYIGIVDVVRFPDGSVKYIRLLDRKTGKEIGEICGHRKEFLPYEGKIIKFRGKLDKQTDLIALHIKH